MAVEPSEDDVLMVMEVTQATRDEAIRYLRVKNNNAENAISAILDGEDIHAAEVTTKRIQTRLALADGPQKGLRWDDSAWSGDREGGSSTGQANPAYDDGNLHPLGSSAAPTRGSSPVPFLARPQTKAQDDEDMERALAMSRESLGYGEQETGVVKGDTFRPATQPHYDPGQWAMTVQGSSNIHQTREIVPDVDVSERRHQDGHPRFIKQLPSGDYLSSFLTIAHSIPAARETMLMRSHLQPSYGQDPEWWKGHAIKLPRIVSTDTHAPIDLEAAQDDEIIAEIQRLMAFLDASDRSYACIDNLIGIATERARDAGTNSDVITDKVLIGLESAAQGILGKDSDFYSLFHSIVGTSRPNAKQSQNVWSLPLTISEEDRRRPGELALADIMDNALWSYDSSDEDVYDTYMEHCAEVLPMRVTQDGTAHSNLGLVIPAHFYVDKYLKDNIATSRVVRKQMAATRKRIADLETVHMNISSIPHPSGSGFVNALELIKLTNGLLTGGSREAVLADFEARGIDIPAGALDAADGDNSQNLTVATQLQEVCEKVASKLAVLEEEKAKAGEMLSKLSHSTSEELGESSLQHRYTLRGVSTKPSVTYVLRRKPTKHSFGSGSDLMDLGSDGPRPPREVDNDPQDDPDCPPGWMWWRIEYDSSHAPGRIMETESTQDDVLRAVELEHSSASLVYASDRAVDHPEDSSLPEALAEFVHNDNKLFQLEAEQQWRASTAAPPRQGWSDAFAGQAASRRSSQGSTMVNYDLADQGEEETMTMDDAPAYSFDDPAAGFGFQGAREATAEVHEIHLDADADAEGERVEEARSNRYSVAMPDAEDE